MNKLNYKIIRNFFVWSALLGVIIGFIIPLILLAQDLNNAAFFSFGSYGLFSALVSLYFTLAIFFLTLIISFYRLKWGFKLIGFISGWIILTGLIIPIVHANGMTELSEKYINGSYLILAIIGSLVVALMLVGVLRSPALVFLSIVLCGSVISAAPNIYKLSISDDRSERFVQISSKKNIFVVSFDGLPGGIILEALKNNPHISKNFKDFEFFVNTVSLAPATEQSILSSLYGNINYHELGNSTPDLISALSDVDLPQNIIEDSYGYGSYGSFSKESRAVGIGKLSKLITTRDIEGNIKGTKRLFELSLSRSFFKFPIYRYSGLPTLLGEVQAWLVSKAITLEGTSSRYGNYFGPDWKLPLLAGYDDFIFFVEHLNRGPSDLSLRQMHFTHTHFPTDFDGECNFRGSEKDWHEKVGNYKATYDQGLCALRQFSLFLDKLKSLEIYNKSVVIFKSDHGEIASYFKDPPNSLKINNHPFWGFNRYLPLLMIKGEDVSRNSMRLNNDLVTLGDLAKTVCMSSFADEASCKKFPGLNLISNYSIKDDPFFYITYTPSPDATFMFNTHNTVKLRRDGGTPLEIFRSNPELNLTK